LLARVYLGIRSGLEQKRGHVASKERSGLRIHYVEPVMVDQHRLLLAPVGPALAADFLYHPCANRTRKWWAVESLSRLAAASTRHVCQCLRPRVLDLGQTDERKQLQINPAYVDLIPLRLELRGMRICVMVVVELFTAKPDRDG
jgi:hypothetical protein